jgi:tetratricopeptide (TPR) repeat protein
MVSFDDAYEWMNRLSDEKNYLTAPIESLVRNMNKAYDVGDYPKVHYYISVIKQVGKSLSDGVGVSLAETHLECARAYYRLGDFRSAVTEFRQTISYYGSNLIPIKHNRAVTHWLLGWTFWRISKQSDAIIQWESSCRIFKDIMSESDFVNFSAHHAWYEKQYESMCEALRQSIENVDSGQWPKG